MVPDKQPPPDERCTTLHTCGVMRQDGLRVRDSGDYFSSTRGAAYPPRERLVTISGRLLLDRPVQTVRMVIEEEFVDRCADENAVIKMKCLGLSSARVTISPDHYYAIRGLTRRWCTTTYILHIQVDEQPALRHSIQLQGIASINRREPWPHSYDITLPQ